MKKAGFDAEWCCVKQLNGAIIGLTPKPFSLGIFKKI